MKKKEFLKLLEQNLGGLPKEEIDNYVEFYSEAISDRMEDGKTEEEAIRDLGGIEEVIKEICGEKSLTSLVRQKVTPKRRITSAEIVLLILGFPLWFPLLMVVLTLLLVGYILTWILVIVTYAVEFGLIAGSGFSIALYFANLANGTSNIGYLGIGLLGIGAAIIFGFVCVAATKVSFRLAKRIVLGIKKALIGGK